MKLHVIIQKIEYEMQKIYRLNCTNFTQPMKRTYLLHDIANFTNRGIECDQKEEIYRIAGYGRINLLNFNSEYIQEI